MSNRISKNQPHYERKVFEFKEIARVESAQLDGADTQLEKIFLNQFVLTADADGLAMFENLYNIIPKPTDTLELRRERILLRIQLQPPFTLRYLEQQLDKIIGAGKYTVDMDYNNYTLTVNSAVENQLYAQEVAIVIGRIKPANIVFVSRPLVVQGLFENETITNIPLQFNYKLGTRWNLGQKPFKSRGAREVIKMADVQSIDDNLLTETASFIDSIIYKIIVNDNVEITDFVTKQVNDNTVELEYNVNNDSGVNFINRLRVCKEDGTVLTDATVYIPVVGETLVNHKISVKEGV